MIALNTVVRNEAPRIIECLTFASAYCDELVVVDQRSDDGTPDLARDFGALVVTDMTFGICEPSRPLAAAHTRSDWIMALDADEHLVADHIPELDGIMADYDGGKFSVACLVDGVRIDPMVGDHFHPNRQYKLYRRGTVEYAMHNHGRITPSPTLLGHYPNVFLSRGEPWVLNVKNQEEWEFDDARYRALEKV